MLSNATKKKNVAHLGAKLCFIKKFKKSFGISSLTASKKKIRGLVCYIFVRVKVLFGVDFKNKFE